MANLFGEVRLSGTSAYNKIEEYVKDIHIHDYQLCTLYTYRDLPKKLKYTFRNDDTGFGLCGEWFFVHDVGYDQVKLKVAQGYSCNCLYKYPGAVKRVEIQYDLNEVFNRSNYNAKKWNKHITQGLNFFAEHNITIKPITHHELSTALALYNEWCDCKLNDGKTFKIMFPQGRYRRCLEYSVETGLDSLLALGAFLDGELIGFRVVGLCGSYCYDLAYVTTRNKKICTDFSERFNINMLKYLKDNYGIQYFNCGLAEGSLKSFKQHFPNTEVIFYRYTKSSVK